MKKNIYAMTLVELIIAITISSIVLLFVVVYISDVLGLIWESRKATSNFVELRNISETLNKTRTKYPIASVDSSSGNDVLILKNIQDNDWVAIWMVQAEDMNISDSSETSTYSEKYLAIRYLQASDTPFDSTISFSWSNYFENIYLKDVDFDIYNVSSGSIVEMNLDFINNYSSQRDGENISDMNQQNFQNYNFSF